MECAKFISLDSVASIERQNVSSNDKMKLAFESVSAYPAHGKTDYAKRITL